MSKAPTAIVQPLITGTAPTSDSSFKFIMDNCR